MSASSEVKTIQTHPGHRTIGYIYCGWDSQMYYCDSYDPRDGFYMTNVLNEAERKCVSERAIERTFHNWNIPQWRAHELNENNQHWMVDARDEADGFVPRLVSFDEATRLDWRCIIFISEHEARSFARRLSKAAEAKRSNSTRPSQ